MKQSSVLTIWTSASALLSTQSSPDALEGEISVSLVRLQYGALIAGNAWEGADSAGLVLLLAGGEGEAEEGNTNSEQLQLSHHVG